MKYATVISISSNRVKLKIKGESVASQVNYYYLDSYQPSVGDTVLIDANLKIVIGKVV